jgi:transcriptional/translational regulatory protein YebC/TACO1
MLAVDAGAEDIEVSEDLIEIYTPADQLHTISTTLSEGGLPIADSELAQVPKNEIELGQKETLQVMSTLEALEELDDVQQVYSGLSISDEALAALETA